MVRNQIVTTARCRPRSDEFAAQGSALYSTAPFTGGVSAGHRGYSGFMKLDPVKAAIQALIEAMAAGVWNAVRAPD